MSISIDMHLNLIVVLSGKRRSNRVYREGIMGSCSGLLDQYLLIKARFDLEIDESLLIYSKLTEDSGCFLLD